MPRYSSFAPRLFAPRRSAPRLAVALLAGAAASASAQVGTLVALPDTQFYSDSATRFPQFVQQTTWIKDFRAPYAIEFVSHLGDVVQNGSVAAEWTRADQAMDVLDTIVPELPYAVVPGNHDYATTGNKGTLATNYVTNFGPARFAGKTWYRGATANGWNSYQIVSIAGREYLHLALEWQPASVTAGQEDAIAWAQSIINANPGMPTILSTHELITDSTSVANGRSSAGEAIWSNLVRNNNQIFLCLNGHFHAGPSGDDGERYEVATNSFGNPVHQLLSDYQDYPNGGDAWLRLYVFNEPADTIHVLSYSPKDNATNTAGAGLSRFFLASPSTPYAMPAGLPALTAGTVQVDANSRFDMPVDFDTRFIAPPPPPPPPPAPFSTLTFREGQNGYVGTLDTYLASATPTTDRGASTVVQVDTVNGSPSGPEHGLLRFENLVGTGAGQIAPDAVIDLATLVLNTTNASANATNVHRMIADWTEASTWASFVGGVQADNTEASSVIDATFTPASIGVLSIDVTSSVEAWFAGQPNRGWALLPTGSDGWAFTSSEGTTITQRPQLSVRVLNPGIERALFQNGVNGYTGTIDTELTQSTPDLNTSANLSYSIDSDDPNGTGGDNHILIQFQNILGTNPGQVPTGSNVLINRAVLVVQGFDAGDGASVHRLLQPWDLTATWNNSFGSNGIQTTGIEAATVEDSIVTGAVGRVEIDVTASLQAWVQDPASNFGWALLPRGSNGWDVRSADSTNPPQLRVYYSFVSNCPACAADYDNNGGVDGGDLASFFSDFEEGSECADVDGNGGVDGGDLATFFALFEDGGC